MQGSLQSCRDPLFVQSAISRGISKKIAELQAAGKTLSPIPGPSWTRTESFHLLSHLLSLCSGLLRRARSRLGLGSVSAQVEIATA